MNAILPPAPAAYNKPGGDRDWGELAREYAEALVGRRETELARRIGVEAETIRALSVGWCAADIAFSLPLTTASRGPCGLILWRLDCWSRFEGKPGLVLPASALEPGGRLLVALDFCDTLSLIDA